MSSGAGEASRLETSAAGRMIDDDLESTRTAGGTRRWREVPAEAGPAPPYDANVIVWRLFVS